MDLFDSVDIQNILKYFNYDKVICWRLEKLGDKLAGYLGEHLKLIISIENNGKSAEIQLFVKCIPADDKWKADYIRKLGFFNKEFMMLSQLFKEFSGDDGPGKWRPKLLFAKEELFVFEDLTKLGYTMPDHTKTFSYKQMIAVIEALAKFNAQSYIYEEKQTKKLKRKYRIWDKYSESLKEPLGGQNWRNAGRKAFLDMLQTFSKYRFEENFTEKLELLSSLFDKATHLMKPKPNFRNTVVHRDLWTNNIFFKQQDNGNYHATLIDYQTVLYASPMLDLSSMIYFNTTRKDRQKYLDDFLEIYYNVLSKELYSQGIRVDDIFTKDDLVRNYEESLVFGMTQASIIVPIAALTDSERDSIFTDPKTCEKVNEVSRSDELIAIANKNESYKERVMELFEEIMEKYASAV